MKPYFSFQWHITDECDQCCKHCYIFSEDNCKKPDCMTFEQMQDVLADVWVSEMEKYRDYSKFKKCSKCELLPWCRGCPAVASGSHGDFYDADPQCWKNISED